MLIKLIKMKICYELLFAACEYVDYATKIRLSRINSVVYKNIYPKIQFVIYWEDDVDPGYSSVNIFLCDSKKDAIDKYRFANKNIDLYGDDGHISIDAFVDGIKMQYVDKKINNLLSSIQMLS